VLTVRVTRETRATPEQVLEAARDFSMLRADVWPNVNLKYLQVHELGATSADVTEGMWFLGHLWERCRYDWSVPGAVTATVLDSNILRQDSTWRIEATPGADVTRVEATFVREYKGGLKGRFARAVFRVAGKQLAGWDLRRALATVEKREAQS
jgi:hypothetical protein